MSMDYTIAVITKIPDPNAGNTGNLAHLPEVYYEIEEPSEENGWTGKAAEFWTMLREEKGIDLWPILPMGPVFVLGQVLFLSEWGRCLTSGLKPSKWYVEYEEVETLDEAIALSRKVQGYEEDK